MSDDFCTINFDESSTLPQYIPILTNPLNDWILPKDKDGNRIVEVAKGELLALSCSQTSFLQSDIQKSQIWAS